MLGVPPRHDVAEVDWIGYRCDSETIVASMILGELKTDVWHTCWFVHDQSFALVWRVDVWFVFSPSTWISSIFLVLVLRLSATMNQQRRPSDSYLGYLFVGHAT